MMNQKNKYYDLILEIITSHRKYAMYETFAKEIEDEVISQVGDILDEIDDINVAKNYLQKIVSTAMVTVPRRFNATNRNNNVQVDTAINSSEDVDNTLTEQNDKESSEIFYSDVADENQALLQMEESETISNSEEINSVIEDENTILSEEYATSVSMDNSDEMISDNKNDETGFTEVDAQLVGDFINGMANDSENKESSDENNVINDLYPPTEENNTLTERLELVTDMVEEPFEQIIDTPEIIHPSEEQQNLDINFVEEQHLEPVNTITEENNLQEETLDLISDITEEPLEPIIDVATENTVEGTLDFLESDTMSDILDISNDNNERMLIAPDDNLTLDEVPLSVDASLISEYSLPSFDVFQLDIEKETLDTNLLLQKINALQDKYVDKNVLEIFKLKYIENHSIQEIAEILETSSDDIADVLVYIVDLVRNL